MSTTVDRSVVGLEFDHTVYPAVTQAAIDAYVAASGEPAPGPGLAPPTFVVSLRARRFLPENLAALERGGLDAGKDIEFGAPIRVGDVLETRSTVHDLYEKTGRTGTMRFLVLRTVVRRADGATVATIDQRMMFR